MYELQRADSDEVPENSRKTKAGLNRSHVVPSNKSIIWADQRQQTLEQLIDHLLHPPILGFPDFNQPFIVHTDASH